MTPQAASARASPLSGALSADMGAKRDSSLVRPVLVFEVELPLARSAM